MRPTVSVDGVKRTNFRVTHRVGAEDFINALCLKYTDHDAEDDRDLPDLTREQITAHVRTVLLEKPDDRYWWRDGFDEEDAHAADELRDWAIELVRRRFPEFC